MIKTYHFVFVRFNDIDDSAEGRDDVDVNGTVWEDLVLEWHYSFRVRQVWIEIFINLITPTPAFIYSLLLIPQTNILSSKTLNSDDLFYVLNQKTKIGDKQIIKLLKLRCSKNQIPNDYSCLRYPQRFILFNRHV